LTGRGRERISFTGEAQKKQQKREEEKESRNGGESRTKVLREKRKKKRQGVTIQVIQGRFEKNQLKAESGRGGGSLERGLCVKR